MVYVLYIFNLYIYQKFQKTENNDFGISYYFKYSGIVYEYYSLRWAICHFYFHWILLIYIFSKIALSFLVRFIDEIASKMYINKNVVVYARRMVSSTNHNIFVLLFFLSFFLFSLSFKKKGEMVSHYVWGGVSGTSYFFPIVLLTIREIIIL